LVDFENNQKFLTADTIVAFVSSKPDKRTKLYKWLSSNAQLKEFPVYREAKVKTFIKENLAPLQISEEGITYFLEKI
jgi:DNA polymerase III delta subunit